MHKNRILIVEDELNLAEPLRLGLEEEGFTVEIAATGQKGIQLLRDQTWDLLLLDLMLPDMSGESIVNYLKQRVDYPPILVLTARSGIEDKLALFRHGCDDYLTKPVIFEELLERIRALLRRSHRVSAVSLQYDDLTLTPQTLTISSKKGEVVVTPKQAHLLRFFLENPERLVSRKELLQNVWGIKEEPETNFLGVHLFNLRKRLAEIQRDNLIHTVRNSGFILKKEDSK